MSRNQRSEPPKVAYDANVPAGVDPEAQWRMGNSTKWRRVGSTAAQRAGADPGYKPGYGASAAGNTSGPVMLGGGITPQNQWDEQFKPRMGTQPAEMPTNRGEVPPAKMPIRSSGDAVEMPNRSSGDPVEMPNKPSGAGAGQNYMGEDTGAPKPSVSAAPARPKGLQTMPYDIPGAEGTPISRWKPQGPDAKFNVPGSTIPAPGSGASDASVTAGINQNMANNQAMYRPGGANFFQGKPTSRAPKWDASTPATVARIASTYANPKYAKTPFAPGIPRIQSGAQYAQRKEAAFGAGGPPAFNAGDGGSGNRNIAIDSTRTDPYFTEGERSSGMPYKRATTVPKTAAKTPTKKTL